MEGTLEALMEGQRMRHRDIPGHLMSCVLRSDADPNEYWLVALFTDRESYIRNADSPEQDEEYQMLRSVLESDPIWHDGEVVYTDTGRT